LGCQGKRGWRRAAKVAHAPNGGYRASRYRPEEFGIDPERERALAYAERFGVAS
jgi:hypothetical protein